MDNIYLFEEFAKKGMGTPEADEHSAKLSTHVENRLHIIMFQELEKIVKELNELGHNLELYDEPVPGDVSYRDNDGDTKPCKLRLGVDTIVSVGFGDTIDE